MHDKEISGMNAAAWALWIIGASLIVADIFATEGNDLGHLGLLAACAGAVLHVRHAQCRLAALIRNQRRTDEVSAPPDLHDLSRR